MSHTNDKYDDLIAKLLAGEISPAEKSELMSWTEASTDNRAYYDTMVTLWQAAETPDDDMFFDSDVENSWQAIETAIDKPAARIRPLRGRRFLLRIAAVLLIGLALSVWYFTRNTSAQLIAVATGPGEKREILLPDSSQVWLNANSELAYAADFRERRVELSGEAFFEVTKQNGATFSIYSGDAVTTVLGTSFNVRAYPDEERTAVRVVSGKVLLARREAAEKGLLLQAGDAGVLDAEALSPKPDLESDVNDLTWRTGTLEFADEKLTVLLPHLEQHYGVTIRVSDPTIYNCHFSGRFEAKPVQQVLEIIAFSLRLEVSSNGETYELSGTGCQ